MSKRRGSEAQHGGKKEDNNNNTSASHGKRTKTSGNTSSGQNRQGVSSGIPHRQSAGGNTSTGNKAQTSATASTASKAGPIPREDSASSDDPFAPDWSKMGFGLDRVPSEIARRSQPKEYYTVNTFDEWFGNPGGVGSGPDPSSTPKNGGEQGSGRRTAHSGSQSSLDRTNPPSRANTDL